MAQTGYNKAKNAWLPILLRTKRPISHILRFIDRNWHRKLKLSGFRCVERWPPCKEGARLGLFKYIIANWRKWSLLPSSYFSKEILEMSSKTFETFFLSCCKCKEHICSNEGTDHLIGDSLKSNHKKWSALQKLAWTWDFVKGDHVERPYCLVPNESELYWTGIMGAMIFSHRTGWCGVNTPWMLEIAVLHHSVSNGLLFLIYLFF